MPNEEKAARATFDPDERSKLGSNADWQKFTGRLYIIHIGFFAILSVAILRFGREQLEDLLIILAGFSMFSERLEELSSHSHESALYFGAAMVSGLISFFSCFVAVSFFYATRIWSKSQVISEQRRHLGTILPTIFVAYVLFIGLFTYSGGGDTRFGRLLFFPQSIFFYSLGVPSLNLLASMIPIAVFEVVWKQKNCEGSASE